MAINKVLIINPFGIGDVLFTTPVIKAIKDNSAEISIGYWCNERVKPVLENNPYIDRIFDLSRGDIKKIYHRSRLEGINRFLSLLRNIKKERFDITLDFSLDYRYSLIAKLLGIKRRAGFNYKKRGRFLTDRLELHGYEGRHVVEYYLDMLKFLNVEIESKPNIELFLSKEDEIWADDFLKRHGIEVADLLIGIAPAGGASWGDNAAYLRWPEEKFASLADALMVKYNAKIILFGSPDESNVCKRIESSLKNNVINTAGKITLGQFMALFKRCKLSVCNDAGPLHVAVSLGLRTICICGPVDEAVYGPYPKSNKHIVIKKELTCRPCYQKFRMPVCDRDMVCINSISVEDVFDAVGKSI